MSGLKDHCFIFHHKTELTNQIEVVGPYSAAVGAVKQVSDPLAKYMQWPMI